MYKLIISLVLATRLTGCVGSSYDPTACPNPEACINVPVAAVPAV